MEELRVIVGDKPILGTATLITISVFLWLLQRSIHRLFFHPLSKFPGPTAAAVSEKWKFFVECIQGRSFCHVLWELHAIYGPVVRVGPNELHFSDPQAYHDIYNNKNRWDKDYRLYHSFNEDRSSFGYITYREAKERKDVLNKMFSPKAVAQAQGLIIEKINALCDAFERHLVAGKSADLLWGYRCMTMDVVIYLCFGNSADAVNAPDFHAPIVQAMDASLPVIIAFKYFDLYKQMILGCPPRLSKILSPATRGMVDVQILIKRQIRDLVQNPERLAYLPHNMTIFHCLMDKEAYRTNTVPSEGSLYEETQALLIAGSDTTGNALMVGSFHLLRQPDTYARFKQEIQDAWRNAGPAGPDIRVLESLPYLNAVIKESLRLSHGVTSGLPRVVPYGGATIAGIVVPSGTIVSCGSTFLHLSDKIFATPHEFRPERWIEDPSLDDWLVAFSKGPRACIGINLAWTELRLGFAHIFHRFDLELADISPSELTFRDCFLPFWLGPHVRAHIKLSET